MNPFRVLTDPLIPEGELRFVNREGNEVGRITNIGTSAFSWAEAARQMPEPVSSQLFEQVLQDVIKMRAEAAQQWGCLITDVGVDIRRDDTAPNILHCTIVYRPRDAR